MWYDADVAILGIVVGIVALFGGFFLGSSNASPSGYSDTFYSDAYWNEMVLTQYIIREKLNGSLWSGGKGKIEFGDESGNTIRIHCYEEDVSEHQIRHCCREWKNDEITFSSECFDKW